MRAYAVAPLSAQWSSTASGATVVASVRVLKWPGTESTASGARDALYTIQNGHASSTSPTAARPSTPREK